MRRLWILLILFLAGAVVAQPPAAQPERIVAIGDLHGDFQAWRRIAGAAGLIDRRGHWTGGRAVLVQMGDIPDRGPDSLAIMRDMMRLEREAARAGGRVIGLVGNHEAMNMIGDLRYVHPGEYAAFATPRSEQLRARAYQANRQRIEAHYRARTPEMSARDIRRAWLDDTPPGKLEHRAAWGPEGELGRWVRRNPAVVKIGDTLFVHAGISAAYASTGIEEINRRTAAALAEADEAPQAIINDPAGPLWYRGLVVREPEGVTYAMPAEEELDLALRSMGARRMVVGHTPSLDGIAVRQGGRLIQVDTGISSYYGGKLTYLEIIGGEANAREVSRE